MSATVHALWFWIKHFVCGLLIGLSSAPGWYHASSWVWRCGVILIAAKVSLYFWVVLIILRMSLLRFFPWFPLVLGFHVWRNVLILAFGMVCLGAAASMIMLDSLAQRGLFGGVTVPRDRGST